MSKPKHKQKSISSLMLGCSSSPSHSNLDCRMPYICHTFIKESYYPLQLGSFLQLAPTTSRSRNGKIPINLPSPLAWLDRWPIPPVGWRVTGPFQCILPAASPPPHLIRIQCTMHALPKLIIGCIINHTLFCKTRHLFDFRWVCSAGEVRVQKHMCTQS